MVSRPNPASAAPASAPEMRFEAAQNLGGNSNVRQPSTFRTGNQQLDGGTAHPACPPTAMSGTHLLVKEYSRLPVASLPNNAKCLCQEPTGSYAACWRFSRRSTGGGNWRIERISPQPSNVVDGKNARFQRHSPRSWSEFGDENPRFQRRSLNRSMNSAMRIRASNASPINHGTRRAAIQQR